MPPVITAFERSPDRGRGLARDMRVRWMLEEIGQPYEVRPLSFEAMKQPTHLARNPFGQIPTYEDGALTLFESGAIVLHLAERHGRLLPTDPEARARTIAWMFAALNTVEPAVFDHSLTQVLERDRPWFDERIQVLEARIRTRLAQLSDHLGEADWLEGDFSVGDLLMASVLLRLKATALLDERTNLRPYLTRAERRPAFQRAFDAQKAAFDAADT
ncbi:glutathione S-transferase family protein [Brevundimonas sp.]|uniref:glutathione S-transferase family protein n=1 Tax=Brevundimonas sp. TaxID=1871086 RepID=UPI001AC1BB2E|nr:glutathione S-transferase family protein [Brevundimonas sp.]MBN9466639.1 glutathione S-transferase family protein [Brevundimonas sp.]